MIARRRRSRLPGVIVGLSLGLLTAAAGPLGADWLVTSDGTRIETRGPWELRGKLVVFTLPAGTLASLRTSHVDLEASRRATAEAAARQAEEAEASQTPSPKEPPPARIVFTDKDFSHTSPHEASSIEKKHSGGGDHAGEQKTNSPLEVSTWRDVTRPGSDGVELFGTLRNPASDIASRVTLVAHFFDEADQEIGAARAVLSQPSILPGGLVNFRLAATDVHAFARVEFEIQSRPLQLAPAPSSIPPGPEEKGESGGT